ncbi:MAG TPA: DNA polymerase III subunit delta' [Bacteroidota bacterium]|nr:DNA polymerase III subunit delta' [Bacteroidota bacterium]
MGWDRIIGQHRVKELLRRVLSSGSVAHAHLFWGGEGVGKDAAAIEFGRALNCLVNQVDPCGTCPSCRKVDQLQHPNLRLIFALPVGKNEQSGDDPVKGLSDDQITSVQEELRLKAENPYHRIQVPKANFIKINSVRNLRREASLSSFEGGKRVFILSHAEDMNAEASNSLLKTLEEPPSDSVFILTTSKKEQLLPTILSRCQLVQFDPLSEPELQEALVSRDGVSSDQAELIARLADGSYTAAQELLSVDMVEQRQEAVQFLRLVLGSQKIPLAHEVERITTLGDRNAVERWMKLLGVWLRDAMVLREQGEEGLLNRDHLGDLTSFNQKFPRARLADALGSVEHSIALVGKNGYLPLVVTSLAIELKRQLAPS